MRLTTRQTAVACAALLTTLLASCAPAPVTEQGGHVKTLYDVFLVAAAVVFVVVAGLIAWSIVRYRARPGDDTLPVQTHVNIPLELAWWALPTLLVIGLFVYTATVLGQVDAPRPSDPVRVVVTGFQWQWKFTYPDAGVEVIGTPDAPPEIVLPVGEQVEFELESADVIHSFYVPRFLIKRDTIPGQTNHVDLTISEPGTYAGQCAEFCGLLHDRMHFSIRAVSPDDYRQWLGSQSQGAQQ